MAKIQVEGAKASGLRRMGWREMAQAGVKKLFNKLDLKSITQVRLIIIESNLLTLNS